MEAPENIYFTQTENGAHYYTEGIPFERKYIEYVRNIYHLLRGVTCKNIE